jgi:hypothetical protein
LTSGDFGYESDMLSIKYGIRARGRKIMFN